MDSRPNGQLGMSIRVRKKLGWEAFAGLVTAAVFKTVEAYESGLGGFDSHPLPPNYLPINLSLLKREFWLAGDTEN